MWVRLGALWFACLAVWLPGWLPGCLAGQLAGLLAGWLAGVNVPLDFLWLARVCFLASLLPGFSFVWLFSQKQGGPTATSSVNFRRYQNDFSKNHLFISSAFMFI